MTNKIATSRAATGVLIGLPWAVFGLLAQTTAPEEPQEPNVVFALQAGRLVPLERQVVPIHHDSIGAYGVSETDAYAVLQGRYSPVRFSQADNVALVVRSPLVALTGADPDTIYVLRKTTSSGEGIIGGRHKTRRKVHIRSGYYYW